MTADAALRLKGLDFERVDLHPGPHVEEMQKIYGEGNATVPGLLVDDEPVHGSRAILARIEEIEPEPSLYPAGRADAVREAERWGDEELQDLGRRLPWGAMYFRPESMGTFGGPVRWTRPAPTSPSSTCAPPGSTTGSPPSGWPTTWPVCPGSSITSTRWPPTASSAATRQPRPISRSGPRSGCC